MDLTYQDQRQYQKNLANARLEEERLFRQQAAQEANLSEEEFDEQQNTKKRNAQEEIRKIKSTSNILYGLTIVIEVFNVSMSFVKLIPIVGLAVALPFSLCMIVVVTQLFYIANLQEHKRVRSRGKFHARLLIVITTHFLGFLPMIDLMGSSIASSLLVIALIKRDRKMAIKEIEAENNPRILIA